MLTQTLKFFVILGRNLRKSSLRYPVSGDVTIPEVVTKHLELLSGALDSEQEKRVFVQALSALFLPSLQRCDPRPVGSYSALQFQLENQGAVLDLWFLSFTTLNPHCFLEIGDFTKEEGLRGRWKG